MNNVSLRGRLTNDPEIRTYMMKDATTGSIASFVLAVPDRNAKRDADGNFPADFIRCSAFGKNAEVVEAYAIKGTELIITAGKLTSGSYEKEGITIFTTEVTVQSFEFVSGTKVKESSKETKKNETKK